MNAHGEGTGTRENTCPACRPRTTEGGGLAFNEITDCRQVGTKDINRLLVQLSPTAAPIGMKELKEIVADANSHLFVLRVGDSVAGMVTVGTYMSPTGRKAWIEDVVVDKGFRGQGLGKMLVEEATRRTGLAGENNLILPPRPPKGEGNKIYQMTLMLTSRPQRVAANRLYQSTGFERKETNVYRKKLP